MPNIYPRRFNAQRGACRALGKDNAKEGVDFTTYRAKNGWTYTIPAIGPAIRAPMSGKALTKRMIKAAADRAEKRAKEVKMDMNPRYRSVAEAAARGDLPDPPDLSAETHKGYRGALRKVVAMVERRDLDGLMAHQMKPTCSGPKMIIRYRDFAIHALKVRKAEGRLGSTISQIEWERGLIASATGFLAISNGRHDRHEEREFAHLNQAVAGAADVGPRSKVYALLPNGRRLIVGQLSRGKFATTEAATEALRGAPSQD